MTLYSLGLVSGRHAQLSQSMETLPDGMNVGQIHKLNFTAWIVIWVFTAPSPGSICNGCSVGPGVHDQYLLQGKKENIVYKKSFNHHQC